MRALHVLLAGIVVVSLVATTGGASSVGTAVPDADDTSPVGAATAVTSPSPTDGPTTRQVSEGNESRNVSVNVLSLPPGAPNQSSVETQYVDLGPALSFASNASTYRIETLTAVENVRSAETTEARQQRILGELNRVEQRVISLRSAQSRTASAFRDGDITQREALVRLARIDIEARALETRRERLATLAEETPEFSVDAGRMDSLSRELDSVTGPVRAHAAAVLQGQSDPTRFYVATSAESVVLSTIVGDAYVREAYRGDVRNRTTNRMSPEEAFDIANRSYPTIWSLRTDTEILGSGDSYLVRVSYPGGDLSAFVDSGSRNVFKEFQRRPLADVDRGEAVSDTRDGLRLEVNRTYPGGPLRVRLTESSTGDPVDANVTVGRDGGESRLVGATGEDGELWTVSPGNRFTVTAIRGNSVVLVTTSPAPAPAVEIVR
jgi:hypothetical protein